MSDLVMLDGVSKTLSYKPGSKPFPPHLTLPQAPPRPLLRRILAKPQPRQAYIRPLLGQGPLHALPKAPIQRRVTILPPLDHRDTPPSSDQTGGFNDMEKEQMELALKLEQHRRLQLESRRHNGRSVETKPAAKRMRNVTHSHVQLPNHDIHVDRRAIRPLDPPPHAAIQHVPPQSNRYTVALPMPTSQRAQADDHDHEDSSGSGCVSTVLLALRELLLILGHLCGTILTAILIFLLGTIHVILTCLVLFGATIVDSLATLLRWIFNLVTCQFDTTSWRPVWKLTGRMWSWARGSQWVWHLVEEITGHRLNEAEGREGVKGSASKSPHADLEKGVHSTRSIDPLTRSAVRHESVPSRKQDA